METALIHTLTGTFEAHAQQAEGGTEFWLARDLQYLLGVIYEQTGGNQSFARNRINPHRHAGQAMHFRVTYIVNRVSLYISLVIRARHHRDFTTA